MVGQYKFHFCIGTTFTSSNDKRHLIDAVASETGLSNAAAADMLEALIGAFATAVMRAKWSS